MDISDHELGMLEQLTYWSEEITDQAGIDEFSMAGQEGRTVGEILSCFDDTALQNLEKETYQLTDGGASGAEWAGIIRYLQNSELKDLTLTYTMKSNNGTGDALALCFAESDDLSQGVVAFRGTLDGNEWADNVEGMNMSDTPCQIDALDYIESLPYASITVTGHSKGSNKAMYVAITSDKVDRCVGYDGQGFSQEFIDKYWAEIEAKGHNITNYSLSTDFVHPLLHAVPNSNQKYCAGYGVENWMQNHSPNSMFAADENGNLIFGEDGKPRIVEVDEHKSMQLVHQFTTFVLNNANDTDQALIINYLAPLLAMGMGNGEYELSKEEYLQLLSSPAGIEATLAYMIQFGEETGASSTDIVMLMATLFGNEINDFTGADELTQDSSFWDKFLVKAKQVAVADILGHLTICLSVFGSQLHIRQHAMQMLFGIDMSKIRSIIQRITGSNGCADAVNRTGTTRDFSKKVYDALMDAITQIEDAGAASVSAWNSYSGESWFTSLLVGAASKGINKYFSRLTETNEKCKTKIDKVFDNVEKVDSSTAAVLTTLCTELQGINTAISGLADSVG